VYAQVFELYAEQSEGLNGSIAGELLPALRTEDGFCGALSLMRRETGEVRLLVFWETEDQAVRPLPPCLASPAGVIPEIWEVGARA
jgi:hypothetical protein